MRQERNVQISCEKEEGFCLAGMFGNVKFCRKNVVFDTIEV